MMRVHLFGTVELRDPAGNEVRSIIAQPKRLALLAWLVIAAPRGFHRRDRLLALFWPEADSEHARNSLRQSLHFLRRALGEAIVVGRGEDEVGIAPGSIWCDVVEFDAAVARNEHRAATGLYRGELLPGFFVADSPELERWLEDQRQRLAEAYAQSLEVVADDAMTRGDFMVAIEHLRRRVALAPLNSRVALRLMTALAAGGERGAAIAHAEHHGDLLREELGAPNDSAIERLARQLRESGETEGPTWTDMAARSAAAHRPVTPEDRGPSGSAAAAVPMVSPLPKRRRRGALLALAGVVAVAGAAAAIGVAPTLLRSSPDGTARALPHATTRSAEALRIYERARRIRIPDAEAAMRFAEQAIAEDSSFAMAHYFVGELSWFSDQQAKSEYHFSRAFELSHDLPARERLLIATRYFYIVQDRPDSARIYATRLLGTAPSDALAYEAVAWMYRAFGWHEYAGAMADTALMLDSSSYGAISTRSASFIDVGDTTGAMTFARRIVHRVGHAEDGARGAAALIRGDWAGELATMDSLYPQTAPGQNAYTLGAAPSRHLILIGMGRMADARAVLSDIRVGSTTQNLPRALLLQARAEVDAGAPSQGRALVAEAVHWMNAHDLSAPATARLVERAADVLARAGDADGIEALRRTIVARDGTHRSHSLSLAQLTLTAARSYAQGEMITAAAELQRSRQQVGYLGRPHATLALLEADARAAAGDGNHAALLYREILATRMGQGDIGTWAAIMRPAAARALGIAASVHAR